MRPAEGEEVGGIITNPNIEELKAKTLEELKGRTEEYRDGFMAGMLYAQSIYSPQQIDKVVDVDIDSWKEDKYNINDNHQPTTLNKEP